MCFGTWYDACDLFVCTFTTAVTLALSSAADVELEKRREYLNMSACCVASPAIVVNVYMNS